MCWDFFWLPAELRHNGSESAPVKIEKTLIRDGKALIVLKNILKKIPLEIVKTYVISSSSSGFKLSYGIRNIGSSSVSFSFWSHNFSGLGKDTYVQLQLRDGIKKQGAEKGAFTFVRQADYHLGFKTVSGILSGNLILIGSSKKKYDISAEFDLSQLMAFYIWNQSQFTFEWIYDEVTLPPGNIWHTEINYMPLKK